MGILARVITGRMEGSSVVYQRAGMPVPNIVLHLSAPAVFSKPSSVKSYLILFLTFGFEVSHIDPVESVKGFTKPFFVS